MKDYKDLKKEFDETFYEGDENSLFCRKHGLHVTPIEVWNWFVSKLQEQEEKIKRESVEEIIEDFVDFIKDKNGWSIGFKDDDYNITSLMRHKKEYLSKSDKDSK